MNNEQGFDEFDRGWRENAQMRLHGREQFDAGDIDGRPLDSPPHAHPSRYGDMSERAEDRRDARWREKVYNTVLDPRDVDEFARSRDRQNERKYKDYSDDFDRRSRSKGYGSEDPSSRRSERSRSRERDSGRHSRDGERSRERSRDRERRARRDDHDSGYGTERLDSDYRSRRRSRSRDRDRDRRYRDSDRDRRYRDSDRDRPRRDRDRVERESSPKEVPWVPPPLPEHLRHLQVQSTLTPATASSSGLESSTWASAHPTRPPVQNQFQNDGSFLDLFRQQMQKQAAASASEDSNPSEGPSTSIVGEPVEVAPPKAKPTLAANSSGLPVIARRRISKILKTGIVQKKKKEEEEEPEDKDGDGWSSYMKEVQRYRANKCIENEASRPPLVK